jgi:hypothetical protein
VTVATGFATAIVFAIILTVADIYVTGHGGRTITGPFLDWPALGVHLSPADVGMLAASAIAAGIAWRWSGRRA